MLKGITESTSGNKLGHLNSILVGIIKRTGYDTGKEIKLSGN